MDLGPNMQQQLLQIEEKMTETLKVVADKSQALKVELGERRKQIDEKIESAADGRAKDVSELVTIGRLRGEYEARVRHRDAQLFGRESLQKTIAEARAYLDRTRSELDAKQNQVLDKRRTLDSRIKQYRDCLGLDIRRVDGNLSFEFWNINHDKPEAKYGLLLNIDHDKYVVVDCPSVVDDHIKPLLDRLNDDGDLGRFVAAVRRVFCQHSASIDAAALKK